MIDLKTHIRDKKGNITSFNHYVLHVKDGVQRFERPPNSGIFYDGSGKLVEGEENLSAVSNEAAAEKLAAENAELKAKLAKLEGASVKAAAPSIDEVIETAKAETSPAKPMFTKK